MKAKQAKPRQNTLAVEATPPKVTRRKTVQSGNSAGRPTQAELERRKAKVMKVATMLFVREGYAATSLVDIARKAGVANRTIYQHFGDKEDIFRSVMFARESSSVFPAPEIGDAEPLYDVMMRLAQYVCDVSFRPKAVEMMRLAIAESKRFPDMMRKVISGTRSRFNTNVTHLFDELVSRRVVQDEATSAFAEIFIHLIVGPTALLISSGWTTALPTPEQLSQKVELFILGRWGPTVAKNAHKPPTRRGRPPAAAAAAAAAIPVAAVPATKPVRRVKRG